MGGRGGKGKWERERGEGEGWGEENGRVVMNYEMIR